MLRGNFLIFSAMMNPEIILLQRKIADYPERIDKMQKRYALVRAPKANNIESAIKGTTCLPSLLNTPHLSPFHTLKCELSMRAMALAMGLMIHLATSAWVRAEGASMQAKMMIERSLFILLK